MLYQVLESPPPLAEKLRLSHIVLICPHHLEVKSPPNVHSHSHKRPLQVSTTGPKFTGKNHQSATKVTLTSHQQGSLPSLPSHSPHSQSTKCTYGPMDIEVYILMSPLHVRASFSGPTSCDRLRLAPLTPISLPSLPACLPHSCLLPSCSSSLPMANEQLSMFQGPHHLWGARGQGVSLEQAGASWSKGIELQSTSICWGPHHLCTQVLECHHLCCNKAPSPHSQVTPLTTKALSTVMAQWISSCTF